VSIDYYDPRRARKRTTFPPAHVMIGPSDSDAIEAMRKGRELNRETPISAATYNSACFAVLQPFHSNPKYTLTFIKNTILFLWNSISTKNQLSF
jgi:hypothetical protein